MIRPWISPGDWQGSEERGLIGFAGRSWKRLPGSTPSEAFYALCDPRKARAVFYVLMELLRALEDEREEENAGFREGYAG